MRTSIATACLFLLSVLVCPRPLEAHGGAFRPPPPRPPPYDGPAGSGGRGGGGGGGPATPGAGGPATPGTPAPTAPAPAAPAGGRSVATLVGGAVPDLSDWSLWWGFNADPYLGLRARVHAAGSVTGSDEFFLGLGSSGGSGGIAPTDADLALKAGPALRRAIEDDPTDRLLCDAMIALAKLHPVYVPAGVRSMSELFLPHLDHPDQRVVESAIVALGLLADGTSARVLCSVAADDEAARRRLGRSRVPSRIRALAAAALGLVGANAEREDERRFVAHTLVRLLEGEHQATPELFVSCVTALGLTRLADTARPAADDGEPSPSASTSRQGQLHFLTELLRDEGRHRFVRAHVPLALARLLRGPSDPEREAVAVALLDTLAGAVKTDRLVRYGVLEALGLVGDADADALDARLRGALRTAVVEEDTFGRQLALLSVALVSSRRGAGAGDPLAGAGAGRALLVEQLARGKRRLRPWAALGLGLFAHHLRAGGGELREEVSEGLRLTLEEVGSPTDAGAWCVALGLRGSVAAAPVLLERLARTHDAGARGRVAIALGLLGAREAIGPLEEIVAEARYRPALLRDAATALALLGHKGVVSDLLEVMRESDSVAVQSAAVAAIAFTGDARAIDPLVELLEDPRRSDLARDFAAIALGAVCERDALPWTASFANHLNYAAATQALISGKGSGILNLR
ncbi:MAG: HEAT repeat domain-containing protein [Planctomycetota bacterium]|nr:HEAT repeat domain-containing protein [Planctomycetota bacterium]